MAAAPPVTAAFPAVESSVRCAEAGLGAQRADIEEGRFLHNFRQCTFAESPHKANGRFFELCKLRCHLLGHAPGVRVLRRVIVADSVFIAVFRRPGITVGKVPGNQERYLSCCARRQR
ncbi:hypothetical protein ES703_73621 [subsurface metagenome]